MTLATRLLIFAMGLVMVLLVPSFAIIDERLRGRMTEERAHALVREARLISNHWAIEKRPQETAARAAGTLGGRVTLIDHAGIVVGDASIGALRTDRLGRRATRPEVAVARAREVGVTLTPGTVAGDELYVAVNTAPGIVRVGVQLATLSGIFDAARRDIALAGAAGILLAAIFATAYARYVSRPVIQLRDIAQDLSRNRFGPLPAIDAPGEVGDLAVSLRELSLQLHNLDSVRRDFIANVSHELCSPLTIASGFAATLARHDPPAEERKQFARAILSNTTRMQRVIDDMLDLSRIESGNWIPRAAKVSVAEVAQEVVDSLQAAAGKKALELGLAIDPAMTMEADHTAVRQTLGNLVENAIRHTAAGRVEITAEHSREGVWLGVSDTGEGIEETHLPRIFERFYRVDSGRTRDSGGSGLGLAIVKHMAEAHGGRVEAQSSLGVGTTIRVLFPGSGARRRTPTPASNTAVIAR